MKYDYSEIMIDTLNSLINNNINDCDKADVLFLIKYDRKIQNLYFKYRRIRRYEKNGTRS